MTTPTRIKELRSQVEQYDGRKKPGSPIFRSIKKEYIYIAVPILTFLFLISARPKFVTEHDRETKSDVLSYSKAIAWTLLIGFIIDAGIYGFYYRSE
jgi:hypothetical protein